MEQPKFSIVVITKNEEETLPHLLDSLEEFRARRGEIVICDTGSGDRTMQVARLYSCEKMQIGNKCMNSIDANLADAVNKCTVDIAEKPILFEGDTYFNFSAARNIASRFASENMILSLDADEVVTNLDIDKINSFIDEGYTKFHHTQVFTHNPDGSDGVKFWQSKFYDERFLVWNNIVHEALIGDGKVKRLEESVLRIDHHQNLKTNRGNYLTGLAIDSYLNPEKDVISHFLGRELFWSNRMKSAESEFKRHLSLKLSHKEFPTMPTHMNSMLYLGNICGLLGKYDEEIEWTKKVLVLEPKRREPVFRFAEVYKNRGDIALAKQYAKRALAFQWNEDYDVSEKTFYLEIKNLLSELDKLS